MAVTVRFYEELNDFLSAARRKRSFDVPFTESRSVKDLIEAQGVPHTEVDLILIDGCSAAFDQVVGDGQRVAVYPAFESLDIGGVSRLGRPPLRDIRFVADVHLGKLVRRLRLLGFDCLYDPAWGDRELADRSAALARVLLTRDRGLLKRSIVTHGMYIRSDVPAEQLRQVVWRLDLADNVSPLSRCLTCNGLLCPVDRQAVRGRVPARTYRHTREYCECEVCGKLYWCGTHSRRLQEIIRQALEPPSAIRG